MKIVDKEYLENTLLDYTEQVINKKIEDNKIAVTDTYSSTGTDAVSGKAVASAISSKANSSQLGTQVTYRLDGTSLYITTK